MVSNVSMKNGKLNDNNDDFNDHEEEYLRDEKLRKPRGKRLKKFNKNASEY